MLSVALFFLTFSFFLPSPASADYKFCNATSYVLQGAIGMEVAGAEAGGAASDTAWQSQGWVKIAPGACAPILQGPVAKGNYYVFARSIDAHQGATKYFSGGARFCTVPKDFTIAGRENCALRGYESSDFIRVATKAGDEWTTTFGEPRNYSLEQAQVAGAQRLLRDNGLRLPKIDGYAAKNTLRAVMAFQRADGRQATGEIDSGLIDALIAGAEREQAKFGLNLCNKTQYLAWAAVGFPAGDEDMSSGWIRVEPGQCAKAIKGKLGAGPYYFYAEASDAKGALVKQAGRILLWSGSETFCVKTTRFEIKGRDACTARGYDERRFRRIDTSGKALFNVPLE
ncbi:MAG: DUF1036 domain-containing protein [Parvibaculum sp.]|uniref:DUF1036 domain-containing protein n=1 Tax=Parvibaculum sp. TaxID=2024848 RepID=UPI0025E5CA00|nr:DUF1036 domain-containing protein [Parvibaculum sp.]MCE9650991.1 DUF1036 domain-containing protein [Parvibaculum sp.]